MTDTALEVLSEGERQQVLLARALMCRAEAVFMDEPAAGLDMGARERLVGHLSDCFGLPLEITRAKGRYSSRARD